MRFATSLSHGARRPVRTLAAVLLAAVPLAAACFDNVSTDPAPKSPMQAPSLGPVPEREILFIANAPSEASHRGR